VSGLDCDIVGPGSLPLEALHLRGGRGHRRHHLAQWRESLPCRRRITPA
jgi:hypothetical protein